MATQTKADRQAAGKKAAATRERNEKKAESQQAGYKAAATRLQNEAADGVKKARTEFGKATSSVGNAAKASGDAVYKTGRSLAARVGIGGKS